MKNALKVLLVMLAASICLTITACGSQNRHAAEPSASSVSASVSESEISLVGDWEIAGATDPEGNFLNLKEFEKDQDLKASEVEGSRWVFKSSGTCTFISSDGESMDGHYEFNGKDEITVTMGEAEMTMIYDGDLDEFSVQGDLVDEWFSVYERS